MAARRELWEWTERWLEARAEQLGAGSTRAEEGAAEELQPEGPAAELRQGAEAAGARAGGEPEVAPINPRADDYV